MVHLIEPPGGTCGTLHCQVRVLANATNATASTIILPLSSLLLTLEIGRRQIREEGIAYLLGVHIHTYTKSHTHTQQHKKRVVFVGGSTIVVLCVCCCWEEFCLSFGSNSSSQKRDKREGDRREGGEVFQTIMSSLPPYSTYRTDSKVSFCCVCVFMCGVSLPFFWQVQQHSGKFPV